MSNFFKNTVFTRVDNCNQSQKVRQIIEGKVQKNVTAPENNDDNKKNKLTSAVCLYTDFDVFRVTFQLRGGVIVDYSSSDLQYPVGKATLSDCPSCPLHGKRNKKMGNSSMKCIRKQRIKKYNEILL